VVNDVDQIIFHVNNIPFLYIAHVAHTAITVSREIEPVVQDNSVPFDIKLEDGAVRSPVTIMLAPLEQLLLVPVTVYIPMVSTVILFVVAPLLQV
jgi:hypothetical protein